MTDQIKQTLPHQQLFWLNAIKVLSVVFIIAVCVMATLLTRCDSFSVAYAAPTFAAQIIGNPWIRTAVLMGIGVVLITVPSNRILLMCLIALSTLVGQWLPIDTWLPTFCSA